MLYVVFRLTSRNVFICVTSIGLSQRDKASPEVGVIGQRVTYSNGPIELQDEDRPREPSPPPVRPACREPIRALRPAKGQPVSRRKPFWNTLLYQRNGDDQLLNNQSINNLLCALGSQSYSNRNSAATHMPEGVVGRGQSLQLFIYDSMSLCSCPTLLCSHAVLARLFV